MQNQLKRYAITIRGKVQHIGYRGIIEGTARKMELKGYVFNDIDESVNIVCEGQPKYVDNFIDTLKDFGRADIESIEKKEIHDSLPLPRIFSRIATDEYYEFSRKFDIGLDYLDAIKADTGDIKVTLGDMKSILGDMKGTLQDVNTGIGDMKGTLGSINNTLGEFVAEQREHNKRMDRHNERLEKILEKLSEK